MQEILKSLQATFNDSDSVCFFVYPNFRIKLFNEKAASNSLVLHGKEIHEGDSILDFARDTKNRIDGKFITCFGRAVSGQQVKQKQQIHYNSVVLDTVSTYTPVRKSDEVVGVSIVVSIEKPRS
ncbi:hypothetical protein ACFSJU_06260 [Paradesertivirga mongoliensis]|uniref:Single cache domain-containing protein n=1 Tax=Paradesertivirga mongoliensis TaxID=2100740 RepID=A0ABW4ZIX2_9SPHI|nr:hypothetical protein [Pedobacter mongoliensis]